MRLANIHHRDLVIHEATIHTPDLAESLVQMFIEVFPEDRHYAGFVRQRVARALEPNPRAVTHQWVVKHGDELVGFRLFSYLRRQNIGVSGYIGVTKAYRGQGIGGWIHNQTIEQVKLDARADGQPEPFGFCGEVDHPDAAKDAHDRHVREERIQIFKRMGAVVLDFGYLEPLKVEGMPLENEADLLNLDPDPMMIYIVPFQSGRHPSPEIVSHMVKGMLIDTYHLPEDSFYIRHALEGIQKGITFV